MFAQVGKTPNAHKYRVIDLDTGQEIDFCYAADDETGEYWVYDLDEDGNIKTEIKDGERQAVKLKKKGKIKLILPEKK